MAENVAIVGEGVKTLSYTSLVREIHTLKQEAMKYEEKILEIEDEIETNVIKKKRKIWSNHHDDLLQMIVRSQKKLDSL